MLTASPTQLLLVLLIVLVLFGARRVPELGRGLGRGLREFRVALIGHDEDSETAELPAAAPPPTTHRTAGR
jgi:sec-independent protein translocase protein TatA